MKNFDCITPNKEHLLICFFLCLALGLYADEKIDSIKAKEAPVVSDTVLNPLAFIYWMLKLIPQKHKKMETAKEKNQRILSEWDKYIAPAEKKD